MQDYRIKVGQIELQIRDYKMDTDPIIFLHFGGGNLMIWQRVVPFFENDYRLILVDLRDHGKSDKPQTEGHIDVMAADIVELMRQLKLDRAHVIGSSLGAEVGLSLAAHYPEKVISLVCDGALCSEYGPYGVWESSENEFKQYVAKYISDIHSRPPKVFPSVDAFVEFYKEIFEKDGCWNSFVADYFQYDAFEFSPGQFTRSWQKQAIENYMTQYFDCRFEEYYSRVQCPVLMLSGEDDEKDEKTCKAMHNLIKLAKNGRLVVVPGWIHPYGWMLDPDGICASILGFLKGTNGQELFNH
ncbi:MAG: hypothetical protein CVU39_08170 [Chloroflexi bacterium HGW-Chloroflexi-10]|nr:MAG: hypothetical protein CVU39_08170 [Chloroflexi bacterium HGW-Chloroflexi-10]